MGIIAEEAVRIRADTKGFQSEVRGGVLGAVGKVAAAAGGLLAAEKIGDFAKDAIKGAASLEVQQRRVRTVFGESSEAVSKFAENAAGKFGISAVAADTMSASMGQVLESMGIGKKRSADMSVELVKMSSDLASFTGKNPADVFNALQKGTLGATRGLKQYGINISQTDVANQALASGIVKPIKNTVDLQNAQIKMRTTTDALTTAIKEHGKNSIEAAKATEAHNKAEAGLQKAMDGTVPKLTTAQKSLASYQLIMKAGSIASGDFQKHSGDLANEQKILSAEFTNISDSIGAVLLPAVTAAGAALITYVPKGLAAIKQGFDVVQPAFDAFKGAVEAVVGTVSGWVQQLTAAQGVTQALGAFVATLAGAFIAYQAALLVARAAMAVAYIAQLALNVALSANPIGLVVIAIAALVAGLVLLYQRSSTAAAIMNTAWEGLRVAAAAVFGYITNTVIPQAIAAWQRFGPGVVAALNAAISTIRGVIQGIATVVSGTVDQIKAHWDTIWALFGPAARAAIQIVKTYVQTELNVIADLFRLFSDLIHGRWGDAWNQLQNVVKDVLNGIVSIVGSALHGLAGTAGALARLVGQAIAAGVKSAVSGLSGLAGDMLGKIRGAINEVGGTAFSLARAIGFNIADGAISGIGNLAGRLGSAIAGAVSSAIHIGGIIHHGSGPWQSTIHSVGEPLARGVIEGFEKHVDAERPRITAAITRMTDAMSTASKKALPGIAKNFQGWVDTLKASFDAQVGAVTKTVEAKFTAAQAKLDSQKAKLTPAEFQIAQQQAAAAVARVEGDVSAAAAALASLPAKQAAAWGALLAQQQANMAALRATLQSNVDDALLAGNAFNRGMAKNAADPLATSLIAAQKTFNGVKTQFDQGLASQEQFIAAANALDDAKTAASEDANATTLLDQYNTWQAAIAQQVAGGQAIIAQQAADNAAQQAQLDQNNADTASAQEAFNQASAARDDFYLQQKAEKERVAKDAEYAKLSDHLKAMHDRTMLHLGNVQHGWDLHYDALKNMATTSGKQIGDNLADALEKSIPTVAGAAAAIANSIAQHLRLRSPAEKGPLSDLDTWWANLTPTLLQGFDASGLRDALSAAVTPNPSSMSIGAGGAAAYNQGMMNTDRMEALLQQIEKHTAATADKPDMTEVHVATGAVVTASAYRSRR